MGLVLSSSLDANGKLARRERRQLLELRDIRSGAEVGTRTGDEQAFHVLVMLDFLNHGEHFAPHGEGHGVHDGGAVEGDGCQTIGD